MFYLRTLAGTRNIRKIIIVTLLSIGSVLIILVAAVLILLHYYKKEIVDQLILETKKSYGINIAYKEINISLTDNGPGVFISLTDVKVINANNNSANIPIFNAGSLSLSLNAGKLLKRQLVVNDIIIKEGNILLERDSLGNSNFKFKKDSASSPSSTRMSFRLNNIYLQNISFDFYNHQKQKHIGLVFNNNSIGFKWFNKNVSVNLKGEITTNEFLFKPAKGPLLFRKNALVDLDLFYLKKEKRIFIDSTSWAMIEEQKYHLAGMAYLDSLQQLALNIKGEVKNFKKTISLLNKQIQNKLASIHIDNPINAEAFFVSKFNKEEDPKLIIKFSGKNNYVTLGSTKVPYSNLSYTGILFCLPDSTGIPDMRNGKLVIKNIKGKVYDFPFRANITLTDLEKPNLSLDANLKADATKIKFKPGRDFDLNGFCYAVIKYRGPVEKLNRLTFLKYPMKLSAEINFDKLSYKTKNNKLPFILNGKAFVSNDKVRFSKLMLATAGGDFIFKGNAEGFTSYVCDLRDGFNADVFASSDFFNITPLLQNSKRDSTKKEVNFDGGKPSGSFEINLTLDIKKLEIRKLKTENAKASIYYIGEMITVKKLNFNSCGGSLSASGYLYNYWKAKADIELKDMNVQTLFEQGENFGQNAMTSENVTGILSATTSIRTNFDNHFKVDPKSLAVEIKSSLKNGHLLDYEPLQKIAQYIFRKRNFKDVSFTEIGPEFNIKGSEMKIKEMEIASSVLNFFVSGTYDFKEQSNLNLVIPWNNLKTRGKNFIPKKSDKEEEIGRGLKLNVYGYPNKLKIRLGNR